MSKLELEKEHEVILKLNDVITLAGDVIINIKNEFVVGNNHVASYFFNTAFIETSK